jgi:putative ABC transport system ATP-binding protein
MIELKNVTKIYNYKTSKELIALKDVNLRVEKNSFVLLKGPSGSGKSTLLSLMAGFTHPTFGRVLVNGEDISKMPDNFLTLFRRKNIGFIFQKFNLLEDISVFDNLIVPLIVDEISYKELRQRANNLMKRFQIYEKRDVIVRKLSGGEQQRVAIARALINEPLIILADEPTANLDSKLVSELFEILKKLKEEGRTIVVATHDERFERLDFIDKIFEVKEGNVLNA